MKTVSADFLIQQNNPNNYKLTRLYIKRRYWDTVTTAYIWESSWTEIDRNEIQRIDPIVHQLDTQTLSEFKVSNVILHLKNSGNLWQEWNTTSGKFMADGVSAFGYEPYLTKFKITTGYENVGRTDPRVGPIVSEGSEELITVFTGVASDYQFDTQSQICKVTVEGLERLLLNGDAEQLTNSVTLETIGTGDGTTKEFYTSYSGVGSITTVTVNSVTMTKGTDYDVSQLNDIDEGAKITLAQPPASTYLVKCSYKHWKKNWTVDQLIDDLVDLTTITSKNISNATLGSISNNITLSSKADFDAGTNTNVSTTTNVGKMTVDLAGSDTGTLWNDFASGDLADNGWTETADGPGAPAVTGGVLRLTNAGGNALSALRRSYSSALSYGMWQFDVQLSDINNGIEFHFIANDDVLEDDSYFVTYGSVPNTSYPRGLLLGKVLSGSHEYLESANEEFFPVDTGSHTIKVIRYSTGKFEVYFDSLLAIEKTDLEIVNGDRMVLYMITDGAGDTTDIDNIYIPNSTYQSASHASQTIDTLSGISAWGNLSTDYNQAPLDTITFETRSSSNGTDWDAWTALTGLAIQSAVKRYIQVRYTIAPGTSVVGDSEEVTTFSSYTVQFTSDRVFVALADFSGQDCYQAISELAKLSDFEWGMNDDEQFFFRTRSTSATPDMTLTQSTNQGHVTLLRYGYAETFAIVRASFGNFIAETASSADSRTSALEIYGRTVFSVSSSILINKDTNVADGIASTYHTRLSTKRRRLIVTTKFVPQIELSDTVSVTFKHDAFGSGPHFISALICKVIGTKHDTETAQSELELEEIL